MGADLENLRQTDSSGNTVQHDKSLGDAFFQVLPKSYDLENNSLKNLREFKLAKIEKFNIEKYAESNQEGRKEQLTKKGKEAIDKTREERDSEEHDLTTKALQ